MPRVSNRLNSFVSSYVACLTPCMNDGAKHVVGSSLSRLSCLLKSRPYVSSEEALTDPAIRKPLVFLSEFGFPRDIPSGNRRAAVSPGSSKQDRRSTKPRHSVSGINGQQAAICEDDSQEGEVLHAAVDELLCVYNAARAQGLKLKPEASWLKLPFGFSLLLVSVLWTEHHSRHG